MNQQDQDTFNSIVALSPEALTDAQIDFLYARRSYLNKAVADQATADANEKAEQEADKANK